MKKPKKSKKLPKIKPLVKHTGRRRFGCLGGPYNEKFLYLDPSDPHTLHFSVGDWWGRYVPAGGLSVTWEPV